MVLRLQKRTDIAEDVLTLLEKHLHCRKNTTDTLHVTNLCFTCIMEKIGETTVLVTVVKNKKTVLMAINGSGIENHKGEVREVWSGFVPNTYTMAQPTAE